MKNKGFIATSLIYSFFLVFLALLAIILNSLIFNNRILDIYNKAIQSRINKKIDQNSEVPSYVMNDLEILNIIPNTTTPNFNSVATVDEGVFISEDDDGTTYYYRGAADNNYVVFGQLPDTGGKILPLYWRIIRINGDGSLRMIYEGYKERGVLNRDPIGVVAWNSSNTSTYFNRAFDGMLNEFYSKNFLGTKYESAISDSGFCSTETSTVDVPASCIKRDDKIFCLNQEQDITNFSDYDKIVTFGTYSVGITPSLKCTKDNKYSVSSSVGNGRLTYPIGLISVNEVVMAGGKFVSSSNQANINNSINMDFYLSKDKNFWTMSKYTRNNNSGNDNETMSNTKNKDKSIRFLSDTNATGSTQPSLNFVFGFSSDGYLVENALNNSLYGLYPVINLKEEYISTLEGDGTITEPFIGELNR